MENNLTKEKFLPNEDKLITETLEIVRKSLEKSYPKGIMQRRFHPKSLGLASAKVHIESLPPHLQQGIFKAPKSFDAWIRFSNASPKSSDDSKKTPRGFALKVLVDEGVQQDFILTTNEILFPGHTKLYLNSLKAMFGNKLLFIPILLNPFNWAGAWSIYKGLKKVSNLLEERYYSATPYLFGNDLAVKWHLLPQKQGKSSYPQNPTPNFLTDKLSKDLKQGTARFDLCIQPQLNAKSEPIEDSYVRWQTDLIKVATVEIPAQELDTIERKTLSENMKFNPWNCLDTHKPLGGNNRIRKVLYGELAKFRTFISQSRDS